MKKNITETENNTLVVAKGQRRGGGEPRVQEGGARELGGNAG